MSKGQISEDYINAWREDTAHFKKRLDRSAIVVGAEKGNIGESIASRLKEELDYVRSPNRTLLDLAEIDSVKRCFFRWRDSDVLVLCNGQTTLGWIEDQDDDDIFDAIGNSLTVSITAVKYFVQHTISQENLKYIVFVGSMAYRNVLNGSAPYCAAKAGLAHFAACMGQELTPKGYRVFCVNPSNVMGTPMTEKTISELMKYRQLTRRQAEEYWNTGLLMPHQLHAEDIAETVAYLVSGKADFLSGSNIDLKGGQR